MDGLPQPDPAVHGWQRFREKQNAVKVFGTHAGLKKAINSIMPWKVTEHQAHDSYMVGEHATSTQCHAGNNATLSFYPIMPVADFVATNANIS
jgi:hypothetical protein